MNHEKPAVRARRGARLLDKRIPGWHNKINVEQLKMNSCYRCILGQIYGFYTRGLYQVFGSTADDREELEHEEVLYGFVALNSEMFDMVHEYEVLTATWKAEILKRREREKMNLTPHTVADTIREIQAEREWDDTTLLVKLLEVIVEKLDKAPEDKTFTSETICRTLIDTLDEMRD